MFDIGFWELGIIALITLLVVGPERLPKIARTAGLWIGRGRRMLSSVKAEIDKEIKAEELKEIIKKQAESNPLQEIIDDTQKTLYETKRETEKALSDSKRAFEKDETSSK